MLGTLNISASGLQAERLRMEVIANNIANASATRTPEGGAFRRKEVVFSTVLKNVEDAADWRMPGTEQLGGVEVLGIVDDLTELPVVYNPGHPDADVEGFVTMPNVNIPIEMVNLVTASRSYEAGVRAIQSFRDMSEQALLIARS
ncbi:MAG: flagellar basal body rod protein FlgC [Planctomycetes bacterium]|nr:flagellar basal body rod protein FlgC [Planctomycetota bacterium]